MPSFAPSSSSTRPLSAPSAALASTRVLGALVAALATLAVAALLGYQIATWGKIAPGVAALGTPVGGFRPAEAEARLRPQVAELLERPLQLRFGDRAWNTTAQALGLRLDPAALADVAYRVGRQGTPLERATEQIAVLVGGTTVSVDSTTDQRALDDSLGRIAREVDRAPRDARLALGRDGTVQYTSPESGLRLDVAASRERIGRALSTGATAVELVVREITPSIADDQVRAAREQLERLLGSNAAVPLTLTFGGKRWPLERAEVVRLLSLDSARPDRPAVVRIDEQPLRALAERIARDVDQTVQDARFQFNGGKLKATRESREGRVLDQAATVALVKQRLLAGERSADLPVAVTRPAASSENPDALGIVELIDRGSTSFSGSLPEKQHNIRLAAERLNGVVVPPGGTFSFNQEVGPTTLAAGFKWGFGITTGEEGARTVPSVAGGICQVSTTLFQRVFQAGYPLEERFWHLYWIPAYTARDGVVGLDATVDEEAGLDFKWINSTDQYVLVQSATDEANVYFALYGRRPAWKVELSQEITNRKPPDPTPIAQAEPALAWGRTLRVESARDGFDVVITRRVVGPDGKDVRPPLLLRSTYQPSRDVTLVGTGGKPVDAKVEEAIARALATPGPTPTPGTPEPTAAATPGAAGTPPAAQPAPAVATPVPTATPRPATPQATLAPPRPPVTATPARGGASAPVPTRAP